MFSLIYPELLKIKIMCISSLYLHLQKKTKKQRNTIGGTRKRSLYLTQYPHGKVLWHSTGIIGGIRVTVYPLLDLSDDATNTHIETDTNPFIYFIDCCLSNCN